MRKRRKKERKNEIQNKPNESIKFKYHNKERNENEREMNE